MPRVPAPAAALAALALVFAPAVIGPGAGADQAGAGGACAVRTAGPWTVIPTPGPPAGPTTVYAVDPYVPSRLFASDGRMVWRSADGGCRWSTVFDVASASSTLDLPGPPEVTRVVAVTVPPSPTRNAVYLLLYGHRDNGPTMIVRQAIQSGQHGPVPGSYGDARQPTTTSMYYEPAPMHQHWHLMGFERMQLRTPRGANVVTDRKNGFCLGDRYPTADAQHLPNAVQDNDTPEHSLAMRLRDNMCGHHDPQAADITAGISVGSGDDYRYDVDFQWLDITHVPSGTYDLVNTVNADRTLLETNYTNNSSAIAISVQWPHHSRTVPATITEPPRVRLLRSCPGQERCASSG